MVNFGFVVKVLVFLTMPLEAMSKDFNEQLEYLWGIKFAITLSNVVAVIVSLLEKPLENLEWYVVIGCFIHKVALILNLENLELYVVIGCFHFEPI